MESHINPSNDVAVIYHYFTDTPRQVAHDLAYPLIRSIATLRGVNSTLPVHVLDPSKDQNDYGVFPRVLNFTVWRGHSGTPDCFGPVQGRLLYRIKEIVNLSEVLPERIILFVDSDIFWFKNPLPLSVPVDRLWTSWRNTGLLWYHKQCPRARSFLQEWCRLNDLMFTDKELEMEVRKGYFGGHVVNDEAVFCHMMVNDSCPGAWGLLPPAEHWGCVERKSGSIPPEAKNFHAFMNIFGKRRGMIPHFITELQNNMNLGLQGMVLPGSKCKNTPMSEVDVLKLWHLVRMIKY